MVSLQIFARSYYTKLLSLLSPRSTLVGVANPAPLSSILEPFNLSLAMKRNLSSWYTAVPTIDLVASLGDLKVQAAAIYVAGHHDALPDDARSVPISIPIKTFQLSLLSLVPPF